MGVKTQVLAIWFTSASDDFVRQIGSGFFLVIGIGHVNQT